MNGTLYLSVPVGRTNKLCFNAHRIFSPSLVIDVMSELKLENLFLIHHANVIKYSREEALAEQYQEIIGEYDCGVFIFKK